MRRTIALLFTLLVPAASSAQTAIGQFPILPWSNESKVASLAISGQPAVTVDANGEYVEQIGQIVWADGSTSAKTVSTSGPSTIAWRPGSVTWSTAGTTLRVGLADIDTANGPPGRSDGTFDVYGDLVQGTDSLTATTAKIVTMSSGSKSLTQGDLVVVRVEMTVRNGSDSVQVDYVSSNGNIAPAYPFVVSNTGGSAALVSGATPDVLIKADDGVYGWLVQAQFTNAITGRTFDSGTGTADEYMTLVSLPFDVAVNGLAFFGRITGDGGSLKAILYSSPTSSPSIETSVTIDTDTYSQSSFSGPTTILFPTAITVSSGTKFGLSLQPLDTNGDVNVFEFDVSTTGAANSWKRFGGTWSKGTRLDATGAASEDANSVMSIGPVLASITAGAGGGNSVMPAGRGGGLVSRDSLLMTPPRDDGSWCEWNLANGGFVCGGYAGRELR